MPCNKPITAWKTQTGVTFKKSESTSLQPLKLPCNQCIGCKLERSRAWAIRCTHEASLHKENTFITLTYNDDHLPKGGSLHYPHFSAFMKRLRKSRTYKYNQDGDCINPIRFYMCGEYGDENLRPHYHALIFNYDFHDKWLHRTKRGNKCYRSTTLEKLWPWGFSELGSVSFKSSAYVARYVMKKITGEPAENHYKRVNINTGEITNVEPEFNRMSLRPGIGKKWFDKYYKDVYDQDQVITRDGKIIKTPKYYDKLLKKIDPATLENIKSCRQQTGRNYQHEQTDERLEAKEQCAKARIENLKRSL